jgi:(2Fe-2S) ferredoxin
MPEIVGVFCPYFEIEPGWGVDRSEIVVCFSYSKSRKLEWDGIWTLKDEEPRDDGKVQIVFLDAHNKHRKIRDLKFPEPEKALFAEKIDSHVRAMGFQKDQYGELIDMNLADFWACPVPEHHWFQKLNPEAKKRIIDFAKIQDRNVERIFVGRIGKGKRPNFRFHFKRGVKDFDGKTFKAGKFEELKSGIKNPKNLVELRLS